MLIRIWNLRKAVSLRMCNRQTVHRIFMYGASESMKPKSLWSDNGCQVLALMFCLEDFGIFDFKAFSTTYGRFQYEVSPAKGPICIFFCVGFLIDSHVKSLIYVSCTVSGSIKGRRSPWRLSIISDTFWAIINLIGSFFTTLFSLEASKSYGKKSGARRPSGFGCGPGGPGGPGGPSGGSGKGPYGGGSGAPRGLDNVRGIDHSAVPPCGSCCAG
ncbi:unnamed protein product [Sphagnum troendelagicum]